MISTECMVCCAACSEGGELGGLTVAAGTGWRWRELLIPIGQQRPRLQDFEKCVHIHEALPQLPVEPAQELEGPPQLRQQALRQNLQTSQLSFQCSLISAILSTQQL